MDAAVRIEIAAESACGEIATIETRARDRGIVTTRDPNATLALLRFETREGGVFGRLEIAGTARVVDAPTCSEAIEALVFTLSLAIEEASVKPAKPRIEFSAGLEGGVFFGGAPVAAPLLGGFIGLASLRGTLVAPAVSLGVRATTPATVIRGVPVAFSEQTASLDGCALALAFGRFVGRPCLRVTMGRMQARASDVTVARVDDRFLATGGVAARASFRLVGPFALEGALGADFAFVKNTYFVGENVVFAAPAFDGWASLGVGVHFP